MVIFGGYVILIVIISFYFTVINADKNIDREKSKIEKAFTFTPLRIIMIINSIVVLGILNSEHDTMDWGAGMILMLPFIFSFFALVTIISYSQKWTPETFCVNDTFIYIPETVFIKNNEKINVNNQTKPYKFLKCFTKNNIGIRLEFAISQYEYNQKTANWLGNHGGPNLNFIFFYHKFNFKLGQ